MKPRLSFTRLECRSGYRSSHCAGQSGLDSAIRFEEESRIIGRTGSRCCVSSNPSRSPVVILTTQTSAAGCAALRTYYLSNLTQFTDPTCKALRWKRYQGC